jgi:hypothetical protein
MKTPWRRNRESRDFDLWVRARRPEASSDFLEPLVARARDNRRVRVRMPLRVGFAASFAIVVAVALASVGGLGYAASAVEESVQEVEAILSPDDEPLGGDPAEDQYKPGKGCGDKNHVHEREHECKITPRHVSQSEGNSGTTMFVFTVSLSDYAIDPVTVGFVTSDGTATVAGADYLPLALSTLTFAPGESAQTVTVPVVGDAVKETDETFYLKLLNPSANAIIVDDTGIGTIQNDDK